MNDFHELLVNLDERLFFSLLVAVARIEGFQILLTLFSLSQGLFTLPTRD